MYVYPVVFTPLDEGGYCVYAPDLKGCITEASNYAEGIAKIRDGLCGMLYILERDKRSIPKPTDALLVEHSSDEIVSLVDAPLEDYRRKVGAKAVRRTISIPEWLDEMAKQSDVSLSQVMQEALIQKFNVKVI